MQFRGLTLKGRFKNAIIDAYERLTDHVDQYRESFEELVEDRDVISEEIKLFYQKNDLGTILSFLRSLGEAGSVGHMQGGMEPEIAGSSWVFNQWDWERGRTEFELCEKNIAPRIYETGKYQRHTQW